MDATLTIQVRILGAQAIRDLKTVQREVNRVAASGGAAGGAGAALTNANALNSQWKRLGATVATTWSGMRAAWADGTNNFNRTIRSLDRVGQSLRRSGQQITFGFTLPFAFATGTVMKWALENERSMTMVEKVYGDVTYSQERVKEETGKLEKAFTALSGIYGVHKADVIDIGAAWAATGLTAVELGKAVQSTMEVMMLGEMDAEKATKSLISIMATWRLSADEMADGAQNLEGRFTELTDALAILNATENSTGARFVDLVDAFDRSSGSARQAGVSIEELAALVATLVPAAGSGSAAGNSLKTLFSRLLAPTKAAVEALKELGIEVNSTEWQNSSASKRLETMAQQFMGLNTALRNSITTTVAGRWQLNKFDVMMADIASGNGMYAKALEQTLDPIRRQGDYLKELNAIMDSNPKKLDTLVNVLKNKLTDSMIQFIPVLIGVMSVLVKLATGFNNLSPGIKNFVFAVGMAIAILGPVLMLVGVFVTTAKNVFMLLKFMSGGLAVFKFAGATFAALMSGVVIPAAKGAATFIRLAGTHALLSARDAVLSAAIWARSFATTAVASVSTFASKVWVSMLLAGDAFKVFASKAWVSMLLAGDAFKAFAGRVWVSMLLAGDAMVAFGGWLVTLPGKVWVSMLLAGDAFRAFAGRVWVSTLLAWDGLVKFVFWLPTLPGKVWISMLLAGDAFVAFAGRVWVSTLLAWDGLVKFVAWLPTLPGKVWISTLLAGDAFVAFAGRVWVSILLAGDALVAFARWTTTLPAKVWVSMLLAGDAFKGFAGRVWVSMLLAGDALVAFVGWTASLPAKVWVSLLLTGDAFKAFTSKVWVTMLLAGDAFKAFVGRVWVSALLVGDALAAMLAPVRVFVGKVWVSMLLAGDAFFAFAGRVWIAAISVVRAGFVMILSFVRTAAAAVVSAVATGAAWLASAVPAIGAAAVAIGAAMATIGLPMWAILAIATAVVAGIVALFSEDFRNAIVDTLQAVVRWIFKLPEAFGRALAALARVVQRMVQGIVDMLSYLNPFQRHSPSLVDNVKAGVRVILDEYSKLKGISRTVLAAAQAHQAFQDAISGAQNSFDAAKTAEQRGHVAKMAPQALPAFDRMVSLRSVLNQQLKPLTAEIAKQAQVVARLESAYKALDTQANNVRRTLDGFERQLDKINDSMKEAEEAISRWSNMGITGMRAMEDAIFDNEMAQKSLKLAIMDLEDAGSSVDDLRDRYAKLNGEMELLRGERQNLYLGGAGSDILSAYDDQIAALQKQRDTIGEASDSISNMAKELERLERIGSRLDLEKSIRFDRPLRQIAQLVDGMEEMPFPVIIANIQKQQEKMAALQPEQKRLNSLVEKQRGILDGILVRRDDIKFKLDEEQSRLDELEKAYSDIKALIDEMTSSMSDFASESERAAKAIEDAFANLDGDYDIFGGSGILAPSDGDIDAWLAEIEKTLEDRLAAMDPFAGMADFWNKGFIGWIKRNLSLQGLKNVTTEVDEWFKRNFSWHGLNNMAEEIDDWFSRNVFSLEGWGNVGQAVIDTLGLGDLDGWVKRNLSWTGLNNIGTDIWNGIWEGLSNVQFFEDMANWVSDYIIAPVKRWLGIESPSTVFKEIGKNIIDGLWQGLTEGFGTIWGVVTSLASGIWERVKVVVEWLEPIWRPFVTATSWAFGVIGNVISIAWNRVILPIFRAISRFVTGVLGPVFRFLYEKFVKPAWDAIGWAVSFVWNRILLPIFRAIGSGLTVLGGVFRWLYDRVVKPVWDWITSKISTSWTKISGVFNSIWGGVVTVLGSAWSWLETKVKDVWNAITKTVKSKAETLAKYMAKGINAAISVINSLTGALGSVAGKLGISIDITPIARVSEDIKFAKGGITPTDPQGGMYAGVRAIVGEGSNVWPEYVIPTDPKYRDRARMLAEAAAHRVGLFAKGGTVGQGKEDGGVFGFLKRGATNAADLAGSALGMVADGMRAMARLAFKPIKMAAEAAANLLPNDFLKGAVRKVIEFVDKKIENTAPVATGDPGILADWKGRRGSYAAILSYMRSTGVPFHPTNISTIRPGATTRGSGNTKASLHSMARAVDFFPPNGGVDNNELLAIYRAFLPVRDVLQELIYSGPGGSNPRNPITRADHHNHVHVGLAQGGAVGANRIYDFANGGAFVPHGGDGILARIGEGMHDERVQIIPLRGDEGKGSGETNLHFHGDLSFPNITSGDEAKKLIDNLKALAD
jgi:TP901 family phage tail tape measure protein